MHAGHLAVAFGVVEAGLASEVWLTPCRLNPLKDGSTLMDNTTRLQLLHKAVAYGNERLGKEALKVCETELEMPSPSYTCNTMEALQQSRPEYQFRLLVGADSYLSFEKWKEWEWLQSHFSPIVYPRPGYEITELKPEWTLLRDVPLTDISSTEIRAELEKNGNLKDFLPWIDE